MRISDWSSDVCSSDVAKELERSECPAGGCIVEIGTGAGVGAIVAADIFPGARIVMTDINPKALALARINGGAAGVTAEALQGRNFASVSGAVDVAMANPPYITDAAHRLYRDGGGMHGAEISMEMARAAEIGRASCRERVCQYG